MNAKAFRTPSTTGHGTLGRNTYRGTALRQIDVALSRSFGLGRATAHMSVEAFNIFNLTNYGPPYASRRSEVWDADRIGSGWFRLGNAEPRADSWPSNNLVGHALLNSVCDCRGNYASTHHPSH